MRVLKYIISAFILIGFSHLNAQEKGTVRGQLIDDATGETIIGGTVVVVGTTTGTVTDLDGFFNLKVAPGKHTIEVSYISYSNQKISDVVVKAGGVTNIGVLRMKEVSIQMEGVVISATQVRNTESALLTMQRKSPNLMDGLSSQTFKKIGDNNAAAAISRVTGVSVEGGRYVYVRGLGDRYTKTVLNGLTIPSLDPDRNNVQMDIFPTNLVDNIVVYKTFTPDLQADFTGGMVDIKTKDFPEEKTLSFSASLGYNTNTHFTDNFYLYKGGKTDWLAFDDGTRKLPIGPYAEFNNPVSGDIQLEKNTKAFNQQLSRDKINPFLNQNYAFSYGNQKNFKKFDYGYSVALSYINQYSVDKENVYGQFRKRSEDSLTHNISRERVSTSRIADPAEQNVLWSYLVGQSIKTATSSYSFNWFRTQNGNSKAGGFNQLNSELNPSLILRENLQYSQRSVDNQSLKGKHSLEKWEIEWKTAHTRSKIYDPDIRIFGLEDEPESEGIYGYNESVGAGASRIWRNLKEDNFSGGLDFTYKYRQWKELDAKLKFGVLETYKQRSFDIKTYRYTLTNNVSSDFTVFDPNSFLADENLWTLESESGVYAIDATSKANSYKGMQNVLGGYLMTELPITKKLKSVFGLRAEKAINKYTGQDNNKTQVFTDSVVLDELDLLPALNLVYEIKDKMNVRASVTKTLARPSFKEKSISQILDPISGIRFNGNINLEETHIFNSDLRWEYFYTVEEMVSVSVFYKHFDKPIEMASFETSPNEIQPINAGTAILYGLEFESRKHLGFINDKWENITLGANFSYIFSRIDMEEVIVPRGEGTQSERESRQNNAWDGETIGRYRPMFGQSPYIVNVYINYGNKEKGINLNLSYNVQGKRLAVIGIGALPDVYGQPFHALNTKVSKDFGKNKQYQLSFNVQNILDDRQESLYEAYDAAPKDYISFYPGRTLSLSFSYTLK